MSYADDVLAIQRLISLHGFHVDSREPEKLVELYWPDAYIDYNAFGKLYQMAPEEFFAEIKLLVRAFDATSHAFSNFDILVDGDKASSRTLVNANHVMDGKDWLVGGIYRHKFERRDGVWKMIRMNIVKTFETGDTGMGLRALEVGHTLPAKETVAHLD